MVRFTARLVRLAAVCLSAALTVAAFGQDARTTLYLPLDGSLTGLRGEEPAAASGVEFVSGTKGQAATFGDPNQVFYTAAGRINAREGSLSFWIRPHVAFPNEKGHVILAWGGWGGMVFEVDGGGYLRSIFNQYGSGGLPEVGVGTDASSWVPEQWHHVAYTWSSSARGLRLYVDGAFVAESSLAADLPAVPDTQFQLGASGEGNYLQADLDELKVSDVARTPQEIGREFMVGLTVTGLTVNPGSLSLMETWTRTPELIAETNLGVISVPAMAALWSVSDASVARVDGAGGLHALRAGHAVVTATLAGASAVLDLTVKAPVRPPTEDSIDPYLSSPAAGALFEMPVAIIRYLPTVDGENVDSAVTDWTSTLADLRARTDQFNLETKFMLEEASRYHGYKDPAAKPTLGYRVVKAITVYEELPPDMNPAHGTGTSGVYFPDYAQIISRFNGRYLVEDLGVKEIWVWGYHTSKMVPAESDMSSGLTGDISNSWRFQDNLPIYGRSYTLYNYNFTRTSNESVHNHGHQWESILSYAAWRQDGNPDLFWHAFTGQDESGHPVTGRCGNCHMPPNTTADYDYTNPELVLSDIEDWNPAGTGERKLVNADTWGSLSYAWPYGRTPDDTAQHNWYIYWGQAMPGRGNAVAYGANRMTNWWAYTGDWDAAVAGLTAQNGLYTSGNVEAPEITAHPAGATVSAGATVRLTVAFTGPGTPTVQWRKGGRLLHDGGAVSGAATAELTLTVMGRQDSGGYDAVVQSGGAIATSRVATIVVRPSAADVAGVLRMAAGLTQWDGASAGDANADGVVDVADAVWLLRGM